KAVVENYISPLLGKNGSLNFTLETNLPYVSWVLVKNADGPNPVRMSILGPKSAIEPTVMTVKDYQPLAEKPYLDALTGKYVSRVSVPLANIQNLEFDTDYTVYFNYIGGLSNPQKIRISSKSVYADLKYDALQFFYFQRSGEAINDLTGPTYRADGQRDRPAGNVVENASCFTGADKHGNYHKGCVLPNGPIDVSGGWYDAADTGKYVVNAGISLWTLQNMIERLQSKRIKDGSGTVVNLGGAESIGGGNAPGAFVDGSMAYPANPKWPNPVGSTALLVDKVGEVNTPISDLMNEARHEMKFLLKMQAPVGTKASVPLGMQDIDWNSIYGVRVAGTTPATGDIGPQVPLGYQTLQFTEVDVSGMAFHSVHDPVWTPVPTWPHASPYQHLRVLETPTTAATLALAATGAQCYRIWKKLDPSFANTCLTAAKKAWAAVTQKYPVTATSVAPVTASIYQYGEYSNVKTLGKDGGPLPAIIDGAGAYADTNVKDEFSWAGMELYLATTSDTISVNGAISTDATPLPGDYFKVATTNAQSKCGSRFPIACENWVNSMRWGNVAPLGTLSALTALPGVFTAPTVKITNFDGGATIRDLDPSPLAQIKTRAELFLGQIATSAYGVPKDSSTYDWGSNADIMNAGLILGIAADVTAGTSAATKYRNGVASTMDYLLGRNSLGKSFVSGYGNNPVMNPHHRVWAKQANIYMKAVPPGVVVGGPNGQAKAGAVGAGRTRASTDKPLYTNGTKEIFLNTGVVTTPENIGDKNIPIDYAAVDYLKTILPACGVYTMQCYADNVKSFHSNEVALNWNAPLFWMAQFLDEQGM
ncbi:MAG: glycoside hydrolase family 9 protein, partial [Pseudomonadota bacterium]